LLLLLPIHTRASFFNFSCFGLPPLFFLRVCRSSSYSFSSDFSNAIHVALLYLLISFNQNYYIQFAANSFDANPVSRASNSFFLAPNHPSMSCLAALLKMMMMMEVKQQTIASNSRLHKIFPLSIWPAH